MKRVAIVRGPNLNSWEMQNFSPLSQDFEFVALCSSRNNYDVRNISLPLRQLWSWGQFFRPRVTRWAIEHFFGDYHDLQGIDRALRGFDIVHTAETMYYCSYQAALAKRRLGFKLVVTVWENIPFNFNTPRTRHLKETIFRETDLFLAATQRARDVLVLEGVPVEKIRVQMPGVDTEHFRPLPKDQSRLREYGCRPDDLIILFVANLYVEKGVYELLFAFKAFLLKTGTMYPVKLLIAGKGPEAPRLESRISQLGLEECVRLIGPHSYTAMPSIHNLADVFVLPSKPAPHWAEQFGYVLIESMACAKSVITTECGSIPEVLGDAGTLVPSSDYIALADALERHISNPSLRRELGQKARVRAEKVFDVRRVALQFKEHYNSVLMGNKSRE
jgi:glycosyltransferase involved in cell wall biosynthesis